MLLQFNEYSPKKYITSGGKYFQITGGGIIFEENIHQFASLYHGGLNHVYRSLKQQVQTNYLKIIKYVF